MSREDVIQHTNQGLAEKPEWLKQRLEWFQDLKFGLILHWGPYSLWDCCESWPISEFDDWARAGDMECWTSRDKDFKRFQRDYWDLNKQFNPTKFDPAEWARVARQSGAKYLAFTTKHHDGFCMWDTATTDYKVTGMECPFHTDARADIFKGVATAFQSEGLAISAYFSKADWHAQSYWSAARPVTSRKANTVGYPEWDEFVDLTHAQIRELMTGYGKIDVLWLDAGWVKGEEDIDMPGLAAMARGLQPGLIIANRTVGDEFEDFITPEHQIPDEPLDSPWESCLVMAQNWKYHPRDVYKSTLEILEMLVEIISKGGNLLLGIGPTSLGEFPAEAVQRLEEIGAWFDVNGEAVYGTRAVAPYREGRVRFTAKGDRVFAFVFDRESFEVDAFSMLGRVSVLGSKEAATLEGSAITPPDEVDKLPLPLVYAFGVAAH